MDPTISDIENFIKNIKCQIPLKVCGSQEESDTLDLLSILGPSSPGSKPSTAVVEKLKDNDHTCNKMKINDEELLQRKLKGKSKQQKRKSVKGCDGCTPSKAGKTETELKIHMAEVRTINIVQLLQMCKRMNGKRLRKVNVNVQASYMFTAAQISRVETDMAITVPNIVVKQEIIDLTEDDYQLTIILKFAKSLVLEDVTYGSVDEFMHKAQEVHIAELSDEESVYQPDCRFDSVNVTVDYRLIIASEKECVNKVVPILYKFHNMHKINEKLRDAFGEIEEFLEHTTHYMCTQTFVFHIMDQIGENLINTLAPFCTKNLDIYSFLQNCTTKLKLLYKVDLDLDGAARYLQTMLNTNSPSCKTELQKRLLAQVNAYVDGEDTKHEMQDQFTNHEPEFTEKHLNQLHSQIVQYREIARRQEQLMWGPVAVWQCYPCSWFLKRIPLLSMHCTLHVVPFLFLASGVRRVRSFVMCSLVLSSPQKIPPIFLRSLHCSAACHKSQAGRYRPTPRRDFPLTYEMANPPHKIAHRKTWNSWNTANLEGGLRTSETAVEDVFIRKFVVGTWHGLFLSEIIIKRQHNVIRIGGIIRRSVSPRKMYFLIGYTEELLSFWLQCPVRLELQTVADKSAVIFKYI